MSAGAVDEPRRKRRSDPGRRDRLIDIARSLIAQRGIAGSSHRAVAEIAGVSLGSMTYHFETLDELHEEAIRRHANEVTESYRARLKPLRTREELIKVIADTVIGDVFPGHQVLTVELYAQALRKPSFRAIVDEWIRDINDIFAQFMPMENARVVNAFIAGTLIHCDFTNAPITHDEFEHALAELVAPW